MKRTHSKGLSFACIATFVKIFCNIHQISVFWSLFPSLLCLNCCRIVATAICWPKCTSTNITAFSTIRMFTANYNKTAFHSQVWLWAPLFLDVTWHHISEKWSLQPQNHECLKTHRSDSVKKVTMWWNTARWDSERRMLMLCLYCSLDFFFNECVVYFVHRSCNVGRWTGIHCGSKQCNL